MAMVPWVLSFAASVLRASWHADWEANGPEPDSLRQTGPLQLHE